MGWKASVGGCSEKEDNQQVGEREEKQRVKSLEDKIQGQLSGHINADGKRTRTESLLSGFHWWNTHKQVGTST